MYAISVRLFAGQGAKAKSVKFRWFYATEAVSIPNLHVAILDQSREPFKRTIIGSFNIIGKTACGKLSTAQMVGDALATDPLFGTWLVAAVTAIQIHLLFTIHSLHQLNLSRFRWG